MAPCPSSLIPDPCTLSPSSTMLDSRHAPRYLRWFDGIALLGGGATLITLMVLLASGSSPGKPASLSQTLEPR